MTHERLRHAPPAHDFTDRAECPRCGWVFDTDAGASSPGYFYLRAKCPRRTCGRRCLLVFSVARDGAGAPCPPSILGVAIIPATHPEPIRAALLLFAPALPPSIVSTWSSRRGAAAVAVG